MWQSQIEVEYYYPALVKDELVVLILMQVRGVSV